MKSSVETLQILRLELTMEEANFLMEITQNSSYVKEAEPARIADIRRNLFQAAKSLAGPNIHIDLKGARKIGT